MTIPYLNLDKIAISLVLKAHILLRLYNTLCVYLFVYIISGSLTMYLTYITIPKKMRTTLE